MARQVILSLPGRAQVIPTTLAEGQLLRFLSAVNCSSALPAKRHCLRSERAGESGATIDGRHLLGNAMEPAATQKDFPRRDTDDLASW